MDSAASFLPGRLGLAESRMPYVDRHGLLYLEYGRLSVEDGTLRFVAAKSDTLDAGDYAVPYQTVAIIMLGPGTSITHDVFRLAARHGVSLVAVGEAGVKCYTAPPMGQARSEVARAHAELWANERRRLDKARQLYAWRFGRIVPHKDIETLRGIEGARMKRAYETTAAQYGVVWQGRLYDRSAPDLADLPNQAINHAATFVEAAAEVAVAALGAVPALGFIHEGSSNAFTLDIADLYRVDVTLPLAFASAKAVTEGKAIFPLEREVRRRAAALFRREKLISTMIERIKELLEIHDVGGDA